MTTNQANVFLLGGLTGGPLIPLLAISQNLANVNTTILGVKNSFESRYCLDSHLAIKFLPKTKLNLLSFKNQSFYEIFLGFIDLFFSFFKLFFSFFIISYLLFRYKPKLILSCGSFLAVPVFWTTKFWKILGLLQTKLILHQQDPLPGLANKLTVPISDLVTCSFEYTKNNYKAFKKANLIPNPIDYTKFDNIKNTKLENLLNQIQNKDLENFLKKVSIQENNKPILLIFGGGSGADFINAWVRDNLDELLECNIIIHLTGLTGQGQLEIEKNNENNKDNYLLLDKLTADMPLALILANRVICRAGLSSITELNYLNKKAFLVPIPSSHQELNARLSSSKFTILEQKNVTLWLKQINSLEYKPIPVFTDGLNLNINAKPKMEYLFRLDKNQIKLKLDEYYKMLNELLNELV